MEKLRPHVVTFPRSGTHYFDKVFSKEAKVKIETSHSVNWLIDADNNKTRTIITIVRDPKDCISSYIAYEENRLVGTQWEINKTRLHQIVTEYILLHHFLYEKADYVIDFDDLITHPEGVAKKIIKLLDIKEDQMYLFDGQFGEEDKDFIESSKKLLHYDNKNLDDFNIDACYFYYNKLLQRKVII